MNRNSYDPLYQCIFNFSYVTNLYQQLYMTFNKKFTLLLCWNFCFYFLYSTKKIQLLHRPCTISHTHYNIVNTFTYFCKHFTFSCYLILIANNFLYFPELILRVNIFLNTILQIPSYDSCEFLYLLSFRCK